MLPLIAKASQSVRSGLKRASSGESGRYANEFMVNKFFSLHVFVIYEISYIRYHIHKFVYFTIKINKKKKRQTILLYDKNRSICIQLKNLSITWFVLL